MLTFAPGMLLVVVIIEIITEQMSKRHAYLVHRILGRETPNPPLSCLLSLNVLYSILVTNIDI